MRQCKKRACDLRSRVSLYRKARNSDGMGGTSVSFECVGHTRGKIERGTASSSRVGDALKKAQTAALWVRRQVELELEMRVVVDGEEFDFVGADPAEPGSQLKRAYLRRANTSRGDEENGTPYQVQEQ